MKHFEDYSCGVTNLKKIARLSMFSYAVLKTTFTKMTEALPLNHKNYKWKTL